MNRIDTDQYTPVVKFKHLFCILIRAYGFDLLETETLLLSSRVYGTTTLLSY